MHSSSQLEAKIQAVQKQQAILLANKELSDLSEEQAVHWCRLNGELSVLAYAAYQIFKDEEKADDAVKYFMLSYNMELACSIYEFNAALALDAHQDLDHTILKQAPETLFTLAVVNLLGIGREKNRANAIILLEHATQENHTESQLLLGLMIEYGEGITKDEVKAIECYRKAAEQGHLIAQKYLGDMYEEGKGIPESKVQAFKWYHEAAKKGHAAAQYSLGQAYDFGKGVARNEEQAFKWYCKAAKQGNMYAQYTLGELYQLGEGVAQNSIYAARLFHKAAEQSYKDAIKKLQQNIPVMKIHLALLKADSKNIEVLTTQDPELIKEVIWDIKSLNELQPSYFENITCILAKINIVSLNKKQMMAMVSGVVDLWYLSYDVNIIEKHIEFTASAATILKRILHLTAALGEPLADSHWLHHCANILIRNSFGLRYEANFITPNFQQLMCFLSFLDMKNISVDEINKKLEIEFVKLCNEINYENFLNQLNEYLQVNYITEKTDSLMYLKNYLNENWLIIEKKDAQIARKVILELTKEVDELILISRKNPDSLFSKRDAMSDYIYQSIASGDLKRLSAFLQEQIPDASLKFEAT